ncbi:MAG: isocitrate lyase/PEP mutase family protein [Gammaproteobacteria bacterium]|nr:isocitrate lyase/PEP mutase family protein [Gammaproteobacteria bacterium]
MSSRHDCRAALARRIRAREFTVAPGVFDMISARVADRAGFDALYMTGYGIAASHMGLPDAGLVSYSEMVGRAARICEGTRTPLIADADTGFGGLLNVRHTVRGYEAAGVAAIQIEDQEFPKKCGHAPGRRVVPLEDMLRKVEVAVDARDSEDLLIIARTDSRSSLGLDEAIRRGQAFAKAGADVVFIEAPESEAEFERIGREIDAALLANMVEGGFSPVLPAETLARLGFAIAIYPGSGFLATAKTLESVYGHLKANGSTIGLEAESFSIGEMHELMGFGEVWEFEKRWAGPD